MKLFRHLWVWAVLVGMILVSLIWVAYRFSWQGTGFQGKTVWDWLQLLIIPLALALVALFFNQVNTRTERQIAQQRYEQDKEAAEKRYERDQEMALDKQREDLLQAYLGHISELLLEKGLRASKPGEEVRIIARTRTISILIQLDARRVGYVFSFLKEARLIDTTDPIIDFNEADFSKVNWCGADLFEANLSGAILIGANLSGALLGRANFSKSRLIQADLSKAWVKQANFAKAMLVEATLNKANLSTSDFSGAALMGANFSQACLIQTNFSGSYFCASRVTGGTRFGEWGHKTTEANLSGADLSGASLKGAQIDKSTLTPEQIAQAIWD